MTLSINEILLLQTKFFGLNKTKDLAFRKRQLKKLLNLLKANEQKLYEAIHKDFRKSEFETYETELAVLYGEIKTTINNLNKWAQPKKVKTNLANLLGKSFIYPEPYGQVLVIGAWNYPFLRN